jgi:predicted aminopeptidase
MAERRRSAHWARLLAVPCRTRNLCRALSCIAAGIIVVSVALSGCSPVYLIRAAYEEGKILWRRQPIVGLLGEPELHDETREKLALVLAVRDYAQSVLGLNVAGSYSSYSYVDRSDLTHLVMAAPKTELRPYTWWFLVVGRVPYKGFFSRSDAEGEADRLEALGYDTNIRTSAAFSTLGWFDDPLLSHLLRYDKVVLAEVVFHELFHNTLYIKGAGAFNESAANFVGHRAAIDFFGERFGADSAEHLRALRAWQEEREFAGFIQEVVGTLSGLYGLDIATPDKLRLREEVFTRTKSEWGRRIEGNPLHRFRGFQYQPLNNAVLMHYMVYLKELQLFESLYEFEGRHLGRTIVSLRQATKRGGEPFSALRSWLELRKAAAAPAADL